MMDLPARTMAACDKKRARKGDGLMAADGACEKVACGMAQAVQVSAGVGGVTGAALSDGRT